ncbi:MAG TPA: hypothetical protein O0X39_00720 [Methanocorpusculum sp.]|nr:hypothetical protein [Methanocorpusculum sp.]
MNEIPVNSGSVICTDGKKRDVSYCALCRHSRYFVVGGKQVPSPALACCSIVRADKRVDSTRASFVGCAEKCGDGFSNVGNIIS